MGFCPVLLRTATSRTRCLPRQSDAHNAPFPPLREIPPVPVLFLSPQRPFAFAGSPYWEQNPPQGQNRNLCPAVASLRGAEPPVFRRFFALCAVFRGGVGYLPYLREERGTQGRQWLFLFSNVGGMCFASVFPATNREKCSAATVFGNRFQYHRRSRTVALLHFCCGFVTDSFFKKILQPQPLLPLCYTCDTSLSGACIPDAICFFPVEIYHPLLLIPDPQRAGILRGTGLN